MDASKTTSVELSAADLALLRQLMFRELCDAAEILAEQATAAANDGSADRENIAGDDAHSTWRHRVQVAAELLDKLGWSVETDTATIVAFEHSRRVGAARCAN